MKLSKIAIATLFGATRVSAVDHTINQDTGGSEAVDTSSFFGVSNADHAGKEEHPKGRFLKQDNPPPGLVDNPGKDLSVKLKKGEKVKSQKVNPKNTIIDPDDDEVIDLNELKPQSNIFSKEHFTPSEDGSYVTEIATGKQIPIEVFGNFGDLDGTADGENVELKDKMIFATKDEKGDFVEVRIHRNNGKGGGRPGETFTKVGNSYVSYNDAQVDMDDINKVFSTGDIKVPPSDVGDKNGNSIRGHEKNRDSKSHNLFERKLITPVRGFSSFFFRRCAQNTVHVINVAVTVDQAFREYCPYPWWFGICLGGRYKDNGRAQAIFTEAYLRYVYSGCAVIKVSHWENLNSNPYGTTSGCNGRGALQKFREAKRSSTVSRDAWHLFTGKDFTDGNVIGCAHTRGICTDWAYGVNHMTYTNSINLQGTLFAHELGHNLGSGHTSGGGIMGGTINGGWPWFEQGSTNVMQNVIEDNCF
mmetsp:Transcript_43885/g.77136  ORF Transcript_43885/g.77136 Transcript_43885/m.77136 type:complete len:473 (-) Transcript_43885:414-1832(-)